MPGTRYVCTDRRCDHETVVSERPSEAPQTIRIGCDRCERLTIHYQVGRPNPHDPLTGGRA